MIDCIPSPTKESCVFCGEEWVNDPNGFYRTCKKSPNLRLAANKLDLPDPLPPGMAQTVAKYAAGQPLGPGDYLHLAIFRWVGEGPTRKCGCKDRIQRMNTNGPQWCREHLDDIVGWMEAEAKKRGWWRYAVAVPGSRYFIKRMVLGAIKKAETNARQPQQLASPIP